MTQVIIFYANYLFTSKFDLSIKNRVHFPSRFLKITEKHKLSNNKVVNKIQNDKYLQFDSSK